MRYLLIAAGLACCAAAATAQTFEGNEATLGTQWKANDGNLSSYLAKGYRVVGVTQQLAASDRGVVNATSYFLQNETSFVRCNELTVPSPTPAAPKAKDAHGPAKPVAPTVILGCADAVAPGPVPFSAKAPTGFESILPGR